MVDIPRQLLIKLLHSQNITSFPEIYFFIPRNSLVHSQKFTSPFTEIYFSIPRNFPQAVGVEVGVGVVGV